MTASCPLHSHRSTFPQVKPRSTAGVLGGPIVLVWDNLRMHLVEPMRQFIGDHAGWLTVFQLPSYSPDLNPQEGIWSLVKRDIGNLAAADLGQITRAVKRRLKQVQYRPDLVDCCLSGTGLIMDG
ncbi:transposase [Streptomyces sp. ME18-1-4]|uniref:transposase n=1 Tax=Streptomyces sp. ME18-1-4 TaxID=3028685 RepID=UPI0029BC9332|nr:transposase [Streptomyces sp. ME18-1-4]MDX3246004.1 transposase [Streptomyces sp. ME18-1-4]